MNVTEQRVTEVRDYGHVQFAASEQLLPVLNTVSISQLTDALVRTSLGVNFQTMTWLGAYSPGNESIEVSETGAVTITVRFVSRPRTLHRCAITGIRSGDRVGTQIADVMHSYESDGNYGTHHNRERYEALIADGVVTHLRPIREKRG